MIDVDYKINELDLTNNKILVKVHTLIRNVFGHPTNDILLNTFTDSSIKNKTLYTGLFINDELIGFNTYISHDFIFNHKITNVYQVCWVVTDPAHQGKGLFVKMVNESIEILKFGALTKKPNLGQNLVHHPFLNTIQPPLFL